MDAVIFCSALAASVLLIWAVGISLTVRSVLQAATRPFKPTP